MNIGKPFEVDKECYERAKAGYKGTEDRDWFYMASEDQRRYFDVSILCGYGLYNCRVTKQGDKYICTYETGSSCD